MKLITFTVPSYNSQDYLSKCVESLLKAGEDAEIIIVNDGSKDDTAKIADEYAAKYPDIVRAVHKENGGHGSGVNKGIELATGRYFKVVDSDDWLREDALAELMATLRKHRDEDVQPDMYVANFVYDKVYENDSYVSKYDDKMPVGKLFGWEAVKPFRLWRMLLMHSLIYRTPMLRDCGLKLPEHTFYVDEIYAYVPLPHVKSMYYMDIDLYDYFIGRSDQSVTIENMTKRYAQQMKVMYVMYNAYSYEQIKKMPKPLRRLCKHILFTISMNVTFFTTAKDDPERRAAFKKMWQDFKASDKKLYGWLRYRTWGNFLLGLMPWKMKGAISTAAYKFLCKHVKLGM